MGGEALCRPLLLTNSETMKGNSPLFGYLGVRLGKTFRISAATGEAQAGIKIRPPTGSDGIPGC